MPLINRQVNMVLSISNTFTKSCLKKTKKPDLKSLMKRTLVN